jgi:hypothetical protein
MAVRTSETSVYSNVTTRRCVPEASDLQTEFCLNRTFLLACRPKAQTKTQEAVLELKLEQWDEDARIADIPAGIWIWDLVTIKRQEEPLSRDLRPGFSLSIVCYVTQSSFTVTNLNSNQTVLLSCWTSSYGSVWGCCAS